MNGIRRFLSILSEFRDVLYVRVPVRAYSLYPPSYVDPVWDKNEIEKLVTSKSLSELEAKNVKAAPTHATCSVFFDEDIHILTQYLMRKGNRILARRLVGETITEIKRIQLKKYYTSPDNEREDIEVNARKIIRRAIQNASPQVKTKMVMKSGTKYYIPIMAKPNQSRFEGIKFLLEAAREKDKKDRFFKSLANEMIDASENKGKAIQRKIDLYKYCEANRAYAHYRWG